MVNTGAHNLASKDKNVLVIGGGTGLSRLLMGLKSVDGINISALVTVADNGQSTGVLTRQFKIPAVGDLRRVIAALSRERAELEQLMDFRFANTNTFLDGHTLGNLLITSSILSKGDFATGIETVCNILNTQGTVIPVSHHFSDLHAELVDGTTIIGESKIGTCGIAIKRVYYKSALASQNAINAINRADYIVLGIGSLYTSLLANLVYPNVNNAIKTSKAKVIYFANLFTQPGETDGMNLAAHIEAIETHTESGFIDQIIMSSTPISKERIAAYAKDKQYRVVDDTKLKNVHYFDLAEEVGVDLVKHSPEKIAKAFNKLLK